MRYCKKCGAEITDGSSFCKKCGNPVQKPSKQESGKKKWVFAICSGIVICAEGITGIFFATGVLGGKGDVGQTGNDISMEENMGEEDCERDAKISIDARDNDILVTEENIEYLLGSWEMEDWKLVKEDEELYIYTQERFDDPDLHAFAPVLSVCVFVKDTYRVYTIGFSLFYLYANTSESEDGGKIGPDFGDIAKSKTYKAFIDTIQYLGE